MPTMPEIRADYPAWIWWAIPIAASLVLVLCAVAIVSEWRRERRRGTVSPQRPLIRRRKGRTHP